MAILNSEMKVYVAGHRGLVGSALVRHLKRKGYARLLTRSRADLDLCNSNDVASFFREERPDAVLIAAAKVGGILANNAYRADFIYENLQIQNNLIWSSHLNDVSRLVFLGSSCIYPRSAPQPMTESSLLTSSLEPTNRPYALAKIAGLELVASLRRQYGRDFFSVMPTNLYGPGDSFHLQNSHVLPALVRKFAEALSRNDPKVSVWGSGTPRREFMFADDCAAAIVHLAESVTSDQLSGICGEPDWCHINIGTGEEISIRALAEAIANAIGYKGEICFDSTKPDGAERKLLDCSLLHKFGFRHQTKLRDGLRVTYQWFLENQDRLS